MCFSMNKDFDYDENVSLYDKFFGVAWDFHYQLSQSELTSVT